MEFSGDCSTVYDLVFELRHVNECYKHKPSADFLSRMQYNPNDQNHTTDGEC